MFCNTNFDFVTSSIGSHSVISLFVLLFSLFTYFLFLNFSSSCDRQCRGRARLQSLSETLHAAISSQLDSIKGISKSRTAIGQLVYPGGKHNISVLCILWSALAGSPDRSASGAPPVVSWWFLAIPVSAHQAPRAFCRHADFQESDSTFPN